MDGMKDMIDGLGCFTVSGVVSQGECVRECDCVDGRDGGWEME